MMTCSPEQEVGMEEQQQHWLFTLSAPMVSINYGWGARYHLPTFGPADGEKFDVQSGWSINDRSGLLRMIARMTDNGHAGSLQSLYAQWHRRMPGDALTTSQSTTYQHQCAELVERTASYCGPGGIKAWDIGRCSFLARVAQLNGWITLEENLWMHSRFALRAHHYYRNWPQYMIGFVVGRGFWMYQTDSDAEGSAEELLQMGSSRWHKQMLEHLLSGESRPFDGLPWDMPLSPVSKPDSLQEMDWE
ncbi:DUF1266 domain-containing protein [Pokkaliibacter sp. CJK22405]|uniref:DUF1266 domain-containing protein n=1 Tax=Pokkaliibacter sp. CJK22405 TaxID=3384615 RepID=UPI003984C937